MHHKPRPERRVALIAAGLDAGHNAVAGRIESLASGLAARSWSVHVVSLNRSPGRTEGLIARAPAGLRRVVEYLGIEGDVMPGTGLRASAAARRVDADVAVISVPPFSLLAIALWSTGTTRIIVDYRDPWNARRQPPPLARLTRPLERAALGRAVAVTYAGGAELGYRLTADLGVPPSRIFSVPNGFDLQDLDTVDEPSVGPHRNGRPLDLVFVGFWYGRNGPVRLPEVLARAGPDVVNLTVIGAIAPPLRCALLQALGSAPTEVNPMGRKRLYRRLATADAAVIALDSSSAIESRIPAKVYDYLAVGVPVIAICPSNAAFLHVDGTDRFHHFTPDAVDAVTTFLRHAVEDRSILRLGRPGAGPSRQQALPAFEQAVELALADHPRRRRR